MNRECTFVEYVNLLIHQYYQSRGIIIKHDIEFNDGGIKSFWLVVKQSMKTYHVYFDSGHGKGPSDGVGVVVKTLLTNAVSTGKKIIYNAKEVFDFLNNNHKINERPFSECHISARIFFFVDHSGIKSYRENLGQCPFSTLKGTSKLHQITMTGNLN